MLTRDSLTRPPAPDAADLADTLAALAFDLEAGRLAAGDVAALTTLTLAADDLLSLAASLAPDPWPYIAARAAVGALPTGADAITAPLPWLEAGQEAAAA